MTSERRIDRVRDRLAGTSPALLAGCAAIVLVASGADARPARRAAAEAMRVATSSFEKQKLAAIPPCTADEPQAQGGSRALADQRSRLTICRLAAAVELSIRGNPAIF
jgi:hypothetical protein